jgi:hypothetical protein
MNGACAFSGQAGAAWWTGPACAASWGLASDPPCSRRRVHRRAACASGPRRVATLHAIKKPRPMSEARREMLKFVAAQREIAIRGTAGKG